MKIVKKISVIFIFIISLSVLIGCRDKSYYVYTLNLDPSFNSVNKVILATLGETPRPELEELWEELNDILIRLDGIFNIHDRDTGVTDLMRINQNAGIAPVVVSEEVIFVLQESIKISELSIINGRALFDPTISPIWIKWDFINKGYIPVEKNFWDAPKKEEIDNLLPLVDYTKVIIDEEANTVMLEDEGMKLDLGSIVKGYAADELKKHLEYRGYNKAVIDIGRNILLLGEYFDKDNNDVPWKVDLATPFSNLGYVDFELIKTYGSIWVSEVTVVTSGTYEKYIMDEDGYMYHHILDPRTGYPVDNTVISVTVVTKISVIGDGYSTALFALGIEDGMALVNQIDDLEAVWVIANGNKKEVYISQGLDNNFQFNTNVERLGYVYKGVYNANT